MPPVLHRQAEAGRHRRPRRALRAPLRPAGQEVTTDRLGHLRALKLGALVGDKWGKDLAARASGSALPGGAALADPSTARAWVLIDDGEVARFGAAMAWAWRAGADALNVLVEEAVPGAARVIARRAAQFSSPPAVFTVHERELQPVSPAQSSPLLSPEAPSSASRPSSGEAPSSASRPSSAVAPWSASRPSSAVAPSSAEAPDASGFTALLVTHGAEPVFEHGVLRGEVLGLEVARVVDGSLQVGVGRHDRWARAEMNPGEDPGAALDEAVSAVRNRRRVGAASHPANTLARGRWLRAVVCARPDLVGAAELRPVEPPLPWFDLPEAGAAPAVGIRTDDGGEIVVVCSVGIDLDLVPTAADARQLYARPDTELVVVVPEGDDPPVLRGLAERLRVPARIRTVPRQWEDLA